MWPILSICKLKILLILSICKPKTRPILSTCNTMQAFSKVGAHGQWSRAVASARATARAGLECLRATWARCALALALVSVACREAFGGTGQAHWREEPSSRRKRRQGRKAAASWQGIRACGVGTCAWACVPRAWLGVPARGERGGRRLRWRRHPGVRASAAWVARVRRRRLRAGRRPAGRHAPQRGLAHRTRDVRRVFGAVRGHGRGPSRLPHHVRGVAAAPSHGALVRVACHRHRAGASLCAACRFALLFHMPCGTVAQRPI